MEGLPSRIERVRALGFGGLAQTFSHSKRGGYRLSSRGVHRGFAPSRAGKRSARRESGFRPSALREATGSIMPVAGVQPKGLSARETGEEGTATPRKRLVKKSGDRERTPDFGIEDEEPAFMRDEFASEPPSSQKRKGSKEDGFRKKEKKLKGDKKFEKGGKMSSKGGSLSEIYPGRDREMKELWDTVAGADSEDDQEGFIGDAPQLEKGHGTRESLDILLGKADSYNPQAEEILLAAIQTESRHGNKKESDILMARQKTLFVGCNRFTNLSKITRRRLLTSTRIQSGVKINVKHLVPYYRDTSDDDNSRANSVHPGENDEVQELACKFLIG
ncbi:hypothetical protein Syun_030961 [Stephania yunnanensis]|uniref:Uncharacterized protein n=1 Tax=Stephania yunnanensis TaxID=152371 RepID=A0AAP0DVQ0_9MAGN